jgi:hypothetical protein
MRELVDDRQQHQDTDDVVCRVVTSQQRHSVDGFRGADEERGDNGEKHQRDQRSDQLEQDVGEGQPFCGAARADRRHRGTGRRSDVLPNDQRASLV